MDNSTFDMEKVKGMKIYIVTESEYSGDSVTRLFLTRDDAEKYIFSAVRSEYSYSDMKRALGGGGLLGYDGDSVEYSISEGGFYHQEKSEVDDIFEAQKQEYEKTKRTVSKSKSFSTPYKLSDPMRDFLLNNSFGLLPDGLSVKGIIADPVSKGYLTYSILFPLLSIYFDKNGLRNEKGKYKLNDELRNCLGERIESLQKMDLAAGRKDARGNPVEPFDPDSFRYFQLSRLFNGAFIGDVSLSQKELEDLEKIRKTITSMKIFHQ